VTWARSRAGLTLEDATQRFSKIAEWEAGESHPTYAQLENLADAFKVPVAVFFFPTPPDLPPIEQTFRTLPEVEIGHLPSKIRLLLRKAKAFQMALAELHGERNPAERLITRHLRFPVNVRPRDMADAVRNFLGVGIAEQIQWPGIDAALEEWRRRLLEVGIYVFKDQFRTDDFAGFCLTDPQFPIIYVNNTTPKARQIFTLFHELAHLLFRTSGIDLEGDGYVDDLVGDARRIEVLCNRFAGVFLVPRDALAEALRVAGGEIDQRIVAQLAARFHVSQLVIYRRLLDTNRIDQAAYDAAHRRAQRERPAVRAGGGDYYNTKLAYLGRRFVGLTLSQYHQHRITAEQAADYLDIKLKNLAALEERYLKGVEV
jgi:Zn-dependent peptidase ImmA (M78 family)